MALNGPRRELQPSLDNTLFCPLFADRNSVLGRWCRRCIDRGRIRPRLGTAVFVAFLLVNGVLTPEIQAQDSSGEASNISELLSLEESAKAALALDSWLVSNEDLASVEFAVSRNLAAQQAAAARASWLADLAEGRQQVAGTVSVAAQRRHQVVSDQLTLLTVETFMFAGEARIDGFGNELKQIRDITPNQVAADNLLQAMKRLDAEVQRLERNEERVTQLAQQARQTADDRVTAMLRGQQMVAEFERIKSDRSDQIRLRQKQVLEDSKKPENLVRVNGFVVDASIADNLAAMLAAAAEEGISIQGWGYRTTEEQIALRLSHCGNSGDAIFDLSAAACEPPTANPLRSEHERGLAIDFTQDGAVLNAGSPGFLWLQEHAAEYGFFNLPSEAWHWSTTGR